MSEVTFNGAGVAGLALTQSQTGVWHADVALTGTDVPTGAAEIDVLGVIFRGTVLRADTSRAIPMARVVGGAGGLGTVLAPKAYRGVDAKLVLSEILAGAGEALAATSDMTALAARLPFWTRMQAKAGEAMAALLRAVGVPAWRVLADGTIWFGTESWPATQLTDEHVLVQDPHLGRFDIQADSPVIYPGETWNGKQVSVVEHRFTSRQLVTSVWVHT